MAVLLKMARCSLCLGDPCVCPKPIGWTPATVQRESAPRGGLRAPAGLVVAASWRAVRSRAEDAMDLAAQVSYGLLASGLVAALLMAVRYR